MTEHDHEPIRGLPGLLPAGERILWQGGPDWRVLARSALYTRWIGAYFALLLVLALAGGSTFGAAVIVLSAALALGLVMGFALLVARTTVYTLTNRRLVLRIGVALNTCINLPLSLVGAAELRQRGGGHGDIALTLSGPHRLGYAVLWPHARPLRFARPQPMLRALPGAAEVARMLADACAQHVAISRAEAPDAPVRPAAPMHGAVA